MRSKRYLIGVDGGGSGCRVALAAPDGRIVAQATGGPANFTTDPDGAIANALHAIEEVAAAAGLDAEGLEACIAHLGLAGVMDQADERAVADAMPFRNMAVSDDRATMVAGALGDRDGVLLALGTGTIIAAQRRGQVRYLGGWGPVLADQASGGWLGRRALQIAMQTEDGLLPNTGFTATVMGHFEGDPIAVVKFAASAQPKEFAAFAPVVFDCAGAGDEQAKALIEEGVAYLEACLDAVQFDETCVLCLAGGVGPRYAPYLEKRYKARIVSALGTALDGALSLARKLRDSEGG
ncbi:BadF/BadG/BcrA/BcrD ATPase family protein [Marivita hallyeonensis]|uniref:Glucosamine kinase n=1 Tax=Marivita hallyeonensis TaxID=996342 RepID=A0A1M5WFZ4_9RHOB|nr:BadF/BadG/BcrA/BcrD ATPase family protein [Marivita hallyeonensis]SHH86318.1 glucosamine kinase [Marivita hallyeonensis]